MSWISLLLFLSTLSVHDSASYAGGAAYARREASACEAVLAFYAAHEKSFVQLAEGSAFTPAFLFGIVAPEITRYSGGINFVELRALKVLYVQGGTAYANFSVGHFQMKPSFVERLEDSLRCRPWLHARFGHCLIAGPTPRATRVERLERLSRLDAQMDYLLLFCTLVEERFRGRWYPTVAARLRFFASAYNTGFHKDAAAIAATGAVAHFPRFSPVKFRYVDIATWFWYRATDCKS